ncbi:MAG TPA: hypothetical protein VNF50_06930 [Acidimicrobiales bacterium]|nr:hypothetical protein [Acidimicrobiales bacterium]
MDALSEGARALAGALEPVAGQVYFSPECHAAYQALGFGPSPGEFAGVAGPDGAAYFCSRGSVMGQVPGEVVAAAFGVFNPAVVVPLVRQGWALTDAATICEARDEGAVGQLRRVLGERPEGTDRANELLDSALTPLKPAGKPLYSGLLSLGMPEDPLAGAWRRADLLREYRGDAHVAAWTAAGLDGTEIGLLTEPYWGLPLRTYIRSRSWSDTELDAAEARLTDRGSLADGTLTDAGRAFREEIEVATDAQCAPIIDALGADLSELLGILRPWGAAIREAKGYPAAGPHDIARRSRS